MEWGCGIHEDIGNVERYASFGYDVWELWIWDNGALSMAYYGVYWVYNMDADTFFGHGAWEADLTL
jgi:hypothetical protein